MRSITQLQAADTAESSSVNDKSTHRQPPKRKMEDDGKLSIHHSQPATQEGESDIREPKRSRTSSGPKVLSSLRKGTRNFANQIIETGNRITPSELQSLKEKRDKRRSSPVHGHGMFGIVLPSALMQILGLGLSSRFGFLRNMRKQHVPAQSTVESCVSVMPKHFPAPIMPRKTSVYAPRDPPQPRKRFDAQESLRRSQTSDCRGLTRSAEPGCQTLSKRPADIAQPGGLIRSASTQTVLRPGLPDFGPAGKCQSASLSTLGLPSSMSTSSLRLVKKQSQADTIRKARPAPLPPANDQRKPFQSTTPSLVKSSTLYAPTASSIARRQATVKPSLDRPLPVPPLPSGPVLLPRLNKTSAFGNPSHDHRLIETDTNIPKPHSMSPRTMKSPSKSRNRAKASGLNAVKSRGNLEDEVAMQQKRADIRARQERLVEERALRELLNGRLDAIV